MPINQINFKLLFIIILLMFSFVGFCIYSSMKIESIKLEIRENIKQMDNLTLQLQKLQEDYHLTDGKKEALEEYILK